VPDDEAMKLYLARPDVQARIQEAMDELRRGSDVPGVTAEELSEFLRRYG
jgi:hypothetical protein